MRRFVIAATVLAVASAALVPSAAFGKGASEASITGPGLARPIALAGEGHSDGQLLMALADNAGFFPAVFRQTPDPMRTARPEGTLGPKYTIAYVMPGPDEQVDTIVQDLYPYALPSPATYTRPDQRYWTTERTVGGWYVSTSTLKDLLVDAGLPETAPAVDSTPSGPPWKILAPVAAVALITALAGLALLLAKRPQLA